MAARGRLHRLLAAGVPVALAAGVFLAVDGGGLAARWRTRAWRLPARIVVEDGVTDLAAAFGPGTVAAEAPGRPVRPEVIAIGPESDPAGGARAALLAPPPARLRFPVDVPPGATLRFDIGLARAPGTAGKAPVHFEVAVDDAVVFSRVLDGRAVNARWWDAAVDVGRFAGQRVTVELRTAVALGGAAPAGTPAWAHVRLARTRTVPRQAAAPDAPNVLVLCIDTLRADAVGVYGARPSPTPNLDAFAARGRVFEHAMSQASWTLLSVSSMLTGLHPTSHGVWGRSADGVPREAFLSDALPTLPGTARRAGISTVALSTNPLVSRATNLLGDFETVVEFRMKRRFHPEHAYPTWARAADVNRVFLDWLTANRDRRFFAWLQYMEPHRPYTPPRDLRPPAPPGIRPEVADGRVGALALAIAREGAPPLPAREVEYLHALYLAETRAWDRELPALLDGLARLGVADRTIVVVTSDHGEEFQEHGHLKHGTHLYEETIAVPLVFVGPGIAPGRSAVLAQGIDLFPTLAARLALTPPVGLPGQDLLAAPVPRDGIAETANGGPGHLVAVRTARWKLITTPATGGRELYDLAADPGERADVWGAHSSEGDRLAAALDAWRRTAPTAPAAAGPGPDLGQKLRALGYVD